MSSPSLALRTLNSPNPYSPQVWAVRARPRTRSFALGTNGGVVASFAASLNIVHGLFQDRYAYRDTLTEVIIHHLISDQKVRIKTRDYVRKIALYRSRLAIQLPDKVLIYETRTADPEDMQYQCVPRVSGPHPPPLSLPLLCGLSTR